MSGSLCTAASAGIAVQLTRLFYFEFLAAETEGAGGLLGLELDCAMINTSW
jgi:hypothetical protein